VTPADAGLLVAAGFGAGLINGIAGGGSLVSFPVLIATGSSALVANVTSTVGIWPGYLGGVAGYREELAGQRDRIRRLAPFAAAGGIVGAVLLLTTPASAFAAAAPFLILFACALFAIQPLLAGRLKGRDAGRDDANLSAPLRIGVFLAGTYGAYFGAGLGVVLLAVLGAALVDRLVRLNGLRGVLALLVNSIALVVFVVAAPVDWPAAGVMAGASLVGGYAGARIARRVPGVVLRVFVIAFGILAAGRLLIG
jgi:uncharacterized membrane protein YfcA